MHGVGRLSFGILKGDFAQPGVPHTSGLPFAAPDQAETVQQSFDIQSPAAESADGNTQSPRASAGLSSPKGFSEGMEVCVCVYPSIAPNTTHIAICCCAINQAAHECKRVLKM